MRIEMAKLYDGWTRDCVLWGQVNLQEHEPARLDLDRWKDYWRRTHIDGITLNAGGIIHYYDTGKEWNWVSPWMSEVGDRDIFGEMVEAARECDLYVLARFTPSRVHEHVARSHPEWLLTDAQRQPVPDPAHDAGGSVRMWYTCMNSGWYRWWLPEIMFRDVMERYDVDGFFMNAWQTPERTIGQDTGTVYVGPCQCDTCRSGFHEATGLNMPRGTTWNRDDWCRWAEWHNDCKDDLGRHYQSAAKALKPHATSVLNLGGDLERMNHSGHWKTQGRTLDIVDHDHQSRSGPIWSMGMPGRLLRATMEHASYYHLFGVYGGIGRTSAQPDAELELITAEMMAAGCRLWYHVIGADGTDRRPFDTVERIFDFFHQNRDYLVDLPSIAQVAIVFSQVAVDQYSYDDADRLSGDPHRGAAHALVRAGIPFDLIDVDDLTESKIDQYLALVLPNQAMLSTEQCCAIREFVRHGGGVVATFESSLYDESGKRRQDFGLTDVFGAESVTRDAVGPIRDASLRIEDHSHLGIGLEGTEFVANGGDLYHVPVQVHDDASAVLTMIPPVPRMPPERSFFHVPRTTTALAVLNDFVEGRSVYFPCDIARWCRPGGPGNPDHRVLLGNAIRYVLGDNICMSVEGPGLVDTHVYRKIGELVMHIVNCENADNGSAPAESITPLHGKSIVLRGMLPVRSIRFLQSGTTFDSSSVHIDGDRQTIAIPPIRAHEIAVVDYRVD
jgi:hypothetical protein